MKVTTDSCLFGAWVAQQIKTEKKQFTNAFDIGAGGGLLSLMISQKNNLQIETIEIDEDSFAQANKNIDASPWKDQILLFRAMSGTLILPVNMM